MSEKLEKMNVLLDKADEDYRGAKTLFEHKDRELFSYIICFHCQQCMEKNLKAFLLYNGRNFPKTHDLQLLVELCLEVKEDFKISDLADYSVYSVEIRYDECKPTVDETEKALEIAGEVREYIKGEIK